jgi:hypothetical protein
MSNRELATFVKDFVEFKRTVYLMRDDFITTIRDNFDHPLAGEDWYAFDWCSAKGCEFVPTFSFIEDYLVKFFWVLVNIHADKIKSTKYQEVCVQLGVDPKAPLIVIYGAIKPLDMERCKNDNNMKRQWGFYLLMLNLSDTDLEKFSFPNKYEFKKELFIENIGMTDTWWFKEARFRVLPLTQIASSDKLKEVAEDLIGLMV